MSTARVYLPSVSTRYDPLSQGRVPTIDLSSAASYGELVLLTEKRQLTDLPAALEDIKDNLADCIPTDYLVSIGDVALVAAAIAYICDMHGSVNLLIWDRNSRKYECLEVSL